MSNRKGFWLYAVLILALWGAVVALGVPWFTALLYAAFQVEIGFRLVEWVAPSQRAASGGSVHASTRSMLGSARTANRGGSHAADLGAGSGTRSNWYASVRWSPAVSRRAARDRGGWPGAGFGRAIEDVGGLRW